MSQHSRTDSGLPNGGGAAKAKDGRINILIVDDEPKNLAVLEAVLDDPGYRLVRAVSAQEALLALVADDFALLILDVRMPGMTGFELAEMIKGRKKTAQVPIIFLTAFYNEDQHVLAGYGTGAVDYLLKPVTPAVLRSKVAVFAELHRSKRDLEAANRALRELNENLEGRVAERTETLAELARRKDEFLAMMSHELRNPLSPIANAVQLLATQQTAETPIQQKARVIIERQLGQLRHLVDDLLEVSRITAGKIQLRREPLVLNDVILGAIETVQPSIAQRRHELSVSLPPEPIRLYADKTRLMQMLVNLLENAAKYTEDNGRIWVKAELSEGSVAIRIRDTGPGISPELLPRIFDLFTQAEQPLDRSQGGLGIGLALVQRFAQLHEGRVEAFSTVGQGSEFVVHLPLFPLFPLSPLGSFDASQPPVSMHDDAPKAKPGLRVMVVDDNTDTVEAFSILLAGSGHEVRTAHDGFAAVRQALEFCPDVMLLDIGLPGLDGYGVAKQLRQAPTLGKTVLIALTGYGQDSDRRAAIQAGFDHHLVKPADFDKLDRILAAVTPNKNPGS